MRCAVCGQVVDGVTAELTHIEGTVGGLTGHTGRTYGGGVLGVFVPKPLSVGRSPLGTFRLDQGGHA